MPLAYQKTKFAFFHSHFDRKLTLLSVGFDGAIIAALIGEAIEQEEGDCSFGVGAASGLAGASHSWAEFVVIVLRVPAVVSVWLLGGPEVVLLLIENMFGGIVFLCQEIITLTKSPATGIGVIAALDLAILDLHVVSDEFADAHVAILKPGAFDTVFVLLAHAVELVNGWTETRVGHGSVTSIETVAAVLPVLALVKLGVVMLHHCCELIVSSISIFSAECFNLGGAAFPCLSGEGRDSCEDCRKFHTDCWF